MLTETTTTATPTTPATWTLQDWCDQPYTLEATLIRQLSDQHHAWLELPYEQRTISTEWVRFLEWEKNGPSDSDWFSVLLHVPTMTRLVTGTGTTRFAHHPSTYDGFFSRPTDDQLAWAREWLAKTMTAMLVAMDAREIAEPQPSAFRAPQHTPWVDIPVVFSSPTSRPIEVRTYARRECAKCNGTGKFARGRSSGDCYTCRGKGCEEQFGKTGVKTKVAAGVKAVAVRPSEFWGTQYRNGYNQPDRDNTRVLVRLEDGRHVSAAVNLLSLDRAPIDPVAKLASMTAIAATTTPGDTRWALAFGTHVY